MDDPYNGDVLASSEILDHNIKIHNFWICLHIQHMCNYMFIMAMFTATWCGYKITGLMLEHFLFKKLHNRNVVTLNVLPSLIPTPLHANLPPLEAKLQVVF